MKVTSCRATVSSHGAVSQNASFDCMDFAFATRAMFRLDTLAAFCCLMGFPVSTQCLFANRIQPQEDYGCPFKTRAFMFGHFLPFGNERQWSARYSAAYSCS